MQVNVKKKYRFWLVLVLVILLSCELMVAVSAGKLIDIGFTYSCKNLPCANGNCPQGVKPDDCVAPCTVSFAYHSYNNGMSTCSENRVVHGYWTFEDKTTLEWAEYPYGNWQNAKQKSGGKRGLSLAKLLDRASDLQ